MHSNLVLNKSYFIVFISILFAETSFCQELKGRLINNQTQEGVANAVVKDKNAIREFISDTNGYFSIPLDHPDQMLDLEIFKENFALFSIKILPADWNLTLQEFYLVSGVGRLANDQETTTNSSDQETDESDVYSLLSSSDDPVLEASSFDWSALRFRLRSVQSTYDQFGINGFLLSNLTSAYSQYNLLSGQNLLTRYGEAYRSYKDNPYDFGSSGLSQWIDAYPANFREGLVIRYSESNRAYRHKMDIHYVSKALKYNWFILAGLNRRWAQEAFIPGSYYDAWGAYFGVSKSLGKQHSFNFLVVHAPVERGKASPATKEVYALAKDNYYNSYWGLQEGEVRNSRIASSKIPMAMLNYQWNLQENIQFETGLLGMKGKRSDSQLDWYNAPDPRPDYYQKLPSYIEDSAVGQRVREAWDQDVNVRQINWTHLYQSNYANETIIENANGLPGNTISGKRAAYWLNERHSDPQELQFFGKLNWNLKRHLFNIKYRLRAGSLDNYLKLTDLLGADFLVDSEDFIDNPIFQNPDARYPNHIIHEGDTYGYHYKSHHLNQTIMADYNYYGRKWDFNAGIATELNAFSREGFFQNAINANSLGTSDKINQNGYSAKSMLTWKINGRNYFRANIAYQKLPNRFDQTFINPEWNANILSEKSKTKVQSGDVSYFYKTPKVKIEFTAYVLNFKDQIINKNFFLDEQLEASGNVDLADGGLINAFYTKLDQRHTGIESSVEYKIGKGFVISGIYTFGDAIYTSRPELLVFDKFSASKGKHLIYLKNFYIPASAMQAGSIVLKYNFKRNGFATLSFNYLSDQYLEPNPLRRIPQAVADLDPTGDQFNKIINQEKLPSAFYVNLFLYKGFKLFNEDFGLTCSINNVLNREGLISGGFEQYRFDYVDKNPDKFPSKYYYLQGINYFCGISWRL